MLNGTIDGDSRQVSDMALPPPQEAVGWMRRNYTTLTTPGRRLVTGA